MSTKPHWLRPEELEKLIHIIEKCVKEMEQKESRKLTDDEVSELVGLAARKVSSNPDGTGVDASLVQAIKLIMDVMKEQKNQPEFEKKYGKDFLSLALEGLGKNPQGLVLSLKLILDFAKKQKNNPAMEQKYGKAFLKRFSELALKCVNEPDNMSKEEKAELKTQLVIMFTELKQALEQAMKNTPEQAKQHFEALEAVKQIAVYDSSGNIVDIEEGVFAPGSKAFMYLTTIEAMEGKSATELALEVMGIIKEESPIYPSKADDLYKGPTPPGMNGV